MLCRNCKKQINNEAKFCKYCGLEIKQGKLVNVWTNTYEWIRNHYKGIIIITVILLAIIFFVSYEDTTQTTVNDANINNQINEVTKGQASNIDELNDYFDKNLKRSVVNIFCSDKGEKISLKNATTGGSGTMLTSDGIVLTNFHVLPYSSESSSYFPSDIIRCLVLTSEPEQGSPEEVYIAKPLAIPDINKKYDLIFLEVTGVYIDEDGTNYGEYPKDFTFYDNTACLGKGNPKLGERIRIFGYPAVSDGWSLTITDGLVSSFDEDSNIMTSAKIDSGNSGGLSVDDNGCMVGVPQAVSIGHYENLGKIISVSNVNNFLSEFRERNGSEKIFTNIKFN